MLMFKERRPAIRTLRGYAISLLQEAGAIRVAIPDVYQKPSLGTAIPSPESADVLATCFAVP